MTKDVFSLGYIQLTGTNGGDTFVSPNDIMCLEVADGYTIVHLHKAGSLIDVLVKQTPGRIRQKVNNLSAKQEKEHQRMEEEAKAKAQENFFDKYPKTKAMFIQEQQELAGK